MLTQVVLMTPEPKTFDIDSVDPEEIIIVKSISGLTPADLTIYTGDYARDGGYYKGRRVGKRNPVFNLKLNPDYKNDIALSDIREMLYEWFLSEENLRVVLKDDRRPDREFVGYTEKLEPDLFARETNAMISMICVDPYLNSVNSVLVNEPSGVVTTPVNYEGSAKAGLRLRIKVNSATSQVNAVIGTQRMTFSGAFIANDIIDVNTVQGSRYIRLNGVDKMASLISGPNWLEFLKGVNSLGAYGSVVGDGKAVITQYEYRAAWWGI